MQRSRTPFHPLLFAAFPVLSPFAHSLDQLGPCELLRPLLLSEGLAVFLLYEEAGFPI